jgi:hypothetical protein
MLSLDLDLATFICKTSYFAIEFTGSDRESRSRASFNTSWDAYEGKHFVLPHAEMPLQHPHAPLLCIAIDLIEIDATCRVYVEQAIDACHIESEMCLNSALTSITYMERGKGDDPCKARNPAYDVSLGDDTLVVYNSRTHKYYKTTENEKIACHYALVDISVLLKMVHRIRSDVFNDACIQELNLLEFLCQNELPEQLHASDLAQPAPKKQKFS